ncbi:hypothetical protein [Priestia endophytica]|uniref:hypothetical protein n=1 Tax=Priestia endophytica TaxID=135735 RepID=UPI0018CF84FB|nr:hypothetical protein [Priestia endophytica]
MFMNIMITASIFIWIAAIYELIKPSKEQNNRKIITLTSFGTLSTLIIIISFFQNFSF